MGRERRTALGCSWVTYTLVRGWHADCCDGSGEAGNLGHGHLSESVGRQRHPARAAYSAVGLAGEVLSGDEAKAGSDENGGLHVVWCVMTGAADAGEESDESTGSDAEK